MNDSDPELPWYQFSLRSLLLFTVFVAVACAVGVHTDWSFSAVIAASAMVGGVSGGMVARTRTGFIVGAVYAIPLFFFTVLCIAILRFPSSWWWDVRDWGLVSRIAVLIGGIAGGIWGGRAAGASVV
jgi:hypothetical protein